MADEHELWHPVERQQFILKRAQGTSRKVEPIDRTGEKQSCHPTTCTREPNEYSRLTHGVRIQALQQPQFRSSPANDRCHTVEDNIAFSRNESHLSRTVVVRVAQGPPFKPVQIVAFLSLCTVCHFSLRGGRRERQGGTQSV